MNVSTCFPEAELANFVAGKLSAERLDFIARHVDDCPTCQDTIVALADSSDTFVHNIRSIKEYRPVETDDGVESGLRRILSDAVASPSRRSGPDGEVGPRDGLVTIQQIGPYQLEKCLGAGGMGTVFKATHTKLKRTVAIKVLTAERWANAAAVSRFHREIEAIGRLDHPHIVRASDAGEFDGLQYLAMDYVDGLDLSKLTRRLGRVEVPEACQIVRQAALGLQYAHERGLVHRDIKPSNLMLAKSHTGSIDGGPAVVVKVMDLGLALLGTESLQNENELTTVGQLMGTLDYMSPEQGSDSHDVDARADIYSLGATLFKLLTGRAPLAEPRYNTLMKKMTALATQPIPSIATVRDDLPAELVTVIDRMLAREPADRFGSAAEVGQALSPFVDGADLTGLLERGMQFEEGNEDDSSPGLSAFPLLARTSRQAVEVPAAELAAAVTNSQADRVGRRRTWFGLSLACFTLAALGFVIYLATDKGELVIRSDVDDVQIAIKQGDRVIEPSISVAREGKQLKLRSGQYEIELIGEADGLSVSKDRVILKRGEQQIVSVERHVGILGDTSAVPTSGTPTYSGRSLAEWRHILDADRNPETLTEALRALAPTGIHNPYQATLDDVVRLMRMHGSNVIDMQPRSKLIEQTLRMIPTFPTAEIAQLMLGEIRSGNERGRDYLILLFAPVQAFEDQAGLQQYHANLIASLNRISESLVSELLALSRSQSVKDRDWAIEFLGFLQELSPPIELPPDMSQQLIDRLQEVLPSDKPPLVLSAARFLVSAAPKTEGLAAALGRILLKTSGDVFSPQADQANNLLRRLGPDAAQVVSDLIESFRTVRRTGVTTNLGHEILKTLGEIGPAAKESIPFLLEISKGENSHADLAREAISKIDASQLPTEQLEPQSFRAGPEVTPHHHATPAEREACAICHIADEAVKLAEVQLRFAKLRFDAGQGDALTVALAEVHLAETNLRLATLTGDRQRELARLDHLVKARTRTVELAQAQYQAGELAYDVLVNLQQALTEARLRWEVAKQQEHKYSSAPIELNDGAEAAPHNHATPEDQAACAICRVADEAVQMAEQHVKRMKSLFEEGGETEKGLPFLLAEASLLDARLRRATLSGDRAQELALLEELVQVRSKAVEIWRSLLEQGTAMPPDFFIQQQALIDARLRLELVKQATKPKTDNDSRRDP